MKYITLLLLLTVIILSCLTIYQFKRNSYYDSRITKLSNNMFKVEHNLKKDSAYVFKQELKEDAYLRDLDSDTELLLFAIAIIFTLFGFISFFNVDHRLKEFISNQSEHHQEHVKKYKSLEHDLYELNAKRDHDVADLFLALGLSYLNDKNHKMFVVCTLKSVEYNARYLLWKKTLNIDFEIKSLIDSLNNVERGLNLNNKIELPYNVFYDIAHIIRKLNNGDIDKLLHTIASKIEFQENIGKK